MRCRWEPRPREVTHTIHGCKAGERSLGLIPGRSGSAACAGVEGRGGLADRGRGQDSGGQAVESGTDRTGPGGLGLHPAEKCTLCVSHTEFPGIENIGVLHIFDMDYYYPYMTHFMKLKKYKKC